MEWDKADVYLYDVVGASILCRSKTYLEPETANSSYIPSSIESEALEDNGRSNSLLVKKTLRKDKPESVLSRVLFCISGNLKNIGQELLKPTIQRQFSRAQRPWYY